MLYSFAEVQMVRIAVTVVSVICILVFIGYIACLGTGVCHGTSASQGIGVVLLAAAILGALTLMDMLDDECADEDDAPNPDETKTTS